jgi:hypothetical protein
MIFAEEPAKIFRNHVILESIAFADDFLGSSWSGFIDRVECHLILFSDKPNSFARIRNSSDDGLETLAIVKVCSGAGL